MKKKSGEIMAKKKTLPSVYIPYNPDRKPTVEITNDVKERLQEIKTKYRLKSFSEAIEFLIDEREENDDKDLEN